MKKLVPPVAAAVFVVCMMPMWVGIAGAQNLPPSPAGPEGRVLFAPELSRLPRGGTACVCSGWHQGGPAACTCDPALPSLERVAMHGGLRVQNLGMRETRIAVVYHGAATGSDPADCDTCSLVGVTCSPTVAPGDAWTFSHLWMGADPSHPITATAAAAASIYSLNTTDVVDYGPPWRQWLADAGLPEDSTMADLVCGRAGEVPAGGAPAHGLTADNSSWLGPPVAPRGDRGTAQFPAAPIGQLEPSNCPSFRAFHEAFLAAEGGLVPGTELPVDPLRGEPIAGVATVIGVADSADKPVSDRYTLVPLDEVGRGGAEGQRAEAGPSGDAAASERYVYALPGGYGFTLDGFHSGVAVQNTSTKCVTVTVTAHRNFHGTERHTATLSVPPNGVFRMDVRDEWPDLIEMATFRVSGDQRLAATLSTSNYATSVTTSARRERDRDTRWLVPRAYQERRPVVLSGLRAPEPGGRPYLDWFWDARRHDAVDGERTDEAASAATGAEGWETNIAMFNPGDVAQEAIMRMQASGEPPAEVLYPIDALAQLVLQPGFRLGPAGGPGWMEIESSGTPPIGVAVESLREADNLEGLTIEAWAASAVPLESGAPMVRTIGLADLGGPAIGDIAPVEVLSRTATMTDSLLARINIQNPLTRTARVAIDSFAPDCGYVGSITRTIDPRQAILVRGADLPGTRFGGNTAAIRVLEGGAAAFVEISRAERLSADISDPPIDVTNAYHGAMSLEAMLAPRVVTATMAVTPTLLTYDAETELSPFDATILVTDSAVTDRCLSYEAVSDVAWITIDTPTGAIPGQLTLTIRPDMAVGVGVLTGTVTLTSMVNGVTDSPATVTVLLTTRGHTLLLPYAGT